MKTFTKEEVVEIIKEHWIKDFKNLNNDPNNHEPNGDMKVNGAGYFVAGFVFCALEEHVTPTKP